MKSRAVIHGGMDLKFWGVEEDREIKQNYGSNIFGQMDKDKFKLLNRELEILIWSSEGMMKWISEELKVTDIQVIL